MIEQLIERFANATTYYERNVAFATLAAAWWEEYGEHLWWRDALRLAER